MRLVLVAEISAPVACLTNCHWTQAAYCSHMSDAITSFGKYVALMNT
jgi:hypothetical protein